MNSPISVGVVSRRLTLGHDLAVVHHEDPIGEREDLVEFRRHDEDCLALIALADDLLVDVLD